MSQIESGRSPFEDLFLQKVQLDALSDKLVKMQLSIDSVSHICKVAMEKQTSSLLHVQKEINKLKELVQSNSATHSAKESTLKKEIDELKENIKVCSVARPDEEEALQQQMSENEEDQQKVLDLDAELCNPDSKLNRKVLNATAGVETAGNSAEQVTRMGDIAMGVATHELGSHAVAFSEQLKVLQQEHRKTESRLEALEAMCAAQTKKDDRQCTVDVQAADGMSCVAQPFSPIKDSLLDQVVADLAEIRRWQSTMEVRTDPETPASKSPDRNTSAFGFARSIHDSGEYEFERSIHDSLFLIRMSTLNFTSSCAIILGYACSVAMVMVCIIILGADEFQEEAFNDKELYMRWRATDAHSAALADPVMQTSLVASVCHDDIGLSMANYQRDFVRDARKYLILGPMLSNAAIFLWVCCCAFEIRMSLNFFAAVCSIPRDRTTVLCERDHRIQFIALSPIRVMLGVYITVWRCVIAMCIATYGSLWLANTLNLENLLLNASALGFLLDIDECIYGVIAPFRLTRLLSRLKPVRVRSSPLTIFNLLAMVLMICGFMIFMNVGPISSQRSNMQEAIKVLCGPEDSHELVQGVNSLGWIIYTTNTWGWNTTYTPVQVEVVSRMVSNPHEADHYAYHIEGTLADLNAHSVLSVADLADGFACDDYNSVERASTTVGKRLWAATGNASLYNLRTCQDAETYCRDLSIVGTNVRLMCAITCGCSEIHSGLWDLARGSSGCPQRQCRKKILRTLADEKVECEDLSIADLKNTGWQAMLDRMLTVRDIKESVHLNLTKFGCKALDPTTMNILDICAMADSHDLFGAAPFCPHSCKCRLAVTLGASQPCPGLCPQSCCPSLPGILAR